MHIGRKGEPLVILEAVQNGTTSSLDVTELVREQIKDDGEGGQKICVDSFDSIIGTDTGPWHLETLKVWFKFGVEGPSALARDAEAHAEAEVARIIAPSSKDVARSQIAQQAQNRQEVLEACIAAGADPNRGNLLGICADRKLSLKAMKTLLVAGADPNGNPICAQRQTPLCKEAELAVWTGDTARVEMLVEHGADVNMVGKLTSHGFGTPLFAAVCAKGDEFVRCGEGPAERPLLDSEAQMRIVKRLIKSGADVSAGRRDAVRHGKDIKFTSALNTHANANGRPEYNFHPPDLPYSHTPRTHSAYTP